MSNKCGDNTYRGCPASFYINCKGFENGQSCWELDDKPCCHNNDISLCLDCRVYARCNSVGEVTLK